MSYIMNFIYIFTIHHANPPQRQIKAAVGVMALLGTGWTVGVFMTVPVASVQIALQYLFIVLNASQVIIP